MRTGTSNVKKYFITGLLIWIPLAITFTVLSWIVKLLDGWIMPWLPEHLQPQTILGFNLPGLGVILCVFILFATGVIGANVLGQRLVRLWESLLARIPVVKSIYYSVKQVSDTLFSSNGQAFRKALLVQYPREGLWTIAFLTGAPGDDIAQHLSGDHVSVDEALKYIISMGVVAPPSRTSEHSSILLLD